MNKSITQMKKKLFEEIDENEIAELNLKKALGTAALAAGLAGSPQMAKAQEPVKTTQTQKQDTAVIGSGIGKSPSESTARTLARLNAVRDLMKKLNVTELKSGIIIDDEKTYTTKNGYEVEMKVKLNTEN